MTKSYRGSEKKAKITGIILAGGKGERMGGEKKASLRIGKKYFIERIIEKLRAVFDNIFIVGNLPPSHRLLGAKVLPDLIPGNGPLGGIYTGLSRLESEYGFFCACDMPFLNVDLLKFMISEIDDNDAVVPMVKGFTEPLHSIYSKKCLPAIKNRLDNEDLKVASFFPQVKCKYIPEEKIRRYDPSLSSFVNLNTREAVESVRK